MSILADREPRITIHRSPYQAEQMTIGEALRRGKITFDEFAELVKEKWK